jgi:iron complex outermembrane recepter protein
MRTLTAFELSKGLSTKTSLRAGALATVALLMASTSAFAIESNAGQSSGASAEAAVTGLPEVTVTAQFRSQNLQNTPIAITAVNSEMLEARSETSIYQVAMQAPSVTLKPQGAAWGASLVASIRGVGQYDFNPALEPGVGMYVDDVYYATLTGSIFDLLDLDRVEILRGPQGTLAGRNSIGGAVKLYSKKPGEGDSYVSATYGSRNRVDFRGSADFKISDTIGARISGVSKSQEGYVKRIDYGCANPSGGIPALTQPSLSDCVVDKESQVNYDGVRGMLRWDNDGPLDVTLIGDYTRDNHNNAGEVIISANNTNPNVNPFGGTIVYDNRFYCGPFCNYSNYFNPETATRPANLQSNQLRYSGWGASGHINYDLGNGMQLQSITAYRGYDEHFANDGDLSPLTVGLGRSDLTFWSFSQEGRLNGQFLDNMVEYTLGGFYMDQKSVYATLQDLRYSPLPPFQGNDPVKADSTAGFVHVALHATDKLTVTGGLRYTDESKSYTFVRLTPDGQPHPILGALNGVVGQYSKNRFDYRANVQYQWTDNVMTYVQYSTGFKGGGINPRPFYATQVQPFGPEKLGTYEIGVKSDLFNGLMRLNADAYYGIYQDIQITSLSCPAFTPGGAGPCALPLNAGNAHVKGGEVETTIQPIEGLSIDGSLSYLDFNYTYINPLAGGPTRPAGVQLSMITPYTPKWKLSGGIQYEVPVQNIGSITPRFDIAYQGRLYTNAVNGPNNLIPGYALANARLTWRDDDNKWQASFEVTNLFDKYYNLTIFDLAGVSGTVLGQPGRPREWALTVKRTF